MTYSLGCEILTIVDHSQEEEEVLTYGESSGCLALINKPFIDLDRGRIPLSHGLGLCPTLSLWD
jgi:hypothetical protein